MGVEAGLRAGAIQTGGFFLSPLGRINLIVTGIFFIFLIITGAMQSVEQKSVYPLLDNTVFKIIGADTKLSNAVDLLESSERPRASSVLSREFPAVVWFWVKFVFEVVSNLWFMYFFCWLIYGFWRAMNQESLIRNIVLTAVTFVLIALFVGMIMYHVSISGKCLVPEKGKVFNALMENSYPLHGTIKFFTHFINGNLANRVVAFGDTSLGRATFNVPDSPNIYNVTTNTTAIINSSNVSGG